MENWSASWFGNELADKEFDLVRFDPALSSAFSCFPLSQSFFTQNTLKAAQALLGKLLWIRTPEGWTGGRIVETEAYRGDDPASHSARGITPRCSVMFGDPGVAYVYFIYGMYEMLNFVTEPSGFPGAVLIRAVEPIWGIPLMEERRKNGSLFKLTSGPGKLCRAMGVRMSHNGQSLQGPSIFVCEDGFTPSKIMKSERIGIRLATENLWRFFIPDNPHVTQVRQNLKGIPVRVK